MGGQKILYASGCVGLGHVTRDISIANQLRQINENVDIVWLADPPASNYLSIANEKVLLDMERVGKGTNDFVNSMVGDYVLNLYPWFSEWYKTFPERVKIINEVAERENVDLIVGDETYDLYIEYLKHPEKKKRPFLLILDFIGGHLFDGFKKNHLVLRFFNGWTYKHLKNVYGREGTIFIGLADDVVDEGLGFLILPSRREVAKKYAYCVGYSLNFNPDKIGSKPELRKKLGYGPEPLIIVTVGGTIAGAPLLRKAAEAFPFMRKSIPNLRMVLVAGPCVPMDYVKPVEGIEVRGMVPNLYEHMAASDLVITTGGGTTTVELQTLNKPFLYFPLEQHFEQRTDVAYHLMRDHVGIRMDYPTTSPEELASAAIKNIGKEADYPQIPIDGARKAAEHINSLLIRIQNGEFKT